MQKRTFVVILLISLVFGLPARGAERLRLFIGNREVITDSPPTNINGRIYVSARSIADALGRKISWDAAHNTVMISPPDFFTIIPPSVAQFVSVPMIRLTTEVGRPVNPDVWSDALRGMEYPTGWVKEYYVIISPYRSADSPNTFANSYWNHSVTVYNTASAYPDSYVAGSAVHEFGHEVWFNFMGYQNIERYMKVRGLDPSAYHGKADYLHQPIEIFAEDFRVLFSSPTAARFRHLNQELPDPSNVKGLREFMLGLVPK